MDALCVVPLYVKVYSSALGDGTGLLTLYETDRATGRFVMLLTATASLRMMKMVRHNMSRRLGRTRLSEPAAPTQD